MIRPAARWFAALVGLALGLCAPAWAAESGLGLRIVSSEGYVSPMGEGTFSLGTVSNRGPAPSLGERIVADDGGAHYVVTFVLKVVRRESLPTPGQRGRHLRTRDSQGRKPASDTHPMRPEPLLLAPQPRRPVDVYARLVGGQPAVGDIRIAVGDQAKWSAGRHAGMSLDAAEVAIGHDVHAGDVVRCQASMYAPDDVVGRLGGSIQFFLR